MAVVPVEVLLRRPGVVAVGPAHGVEGCGVGGVPEMDADGLIGAVASGCGLSGDGGMVVSGVAVEATVPTTLEADVGIIHGLQIQVVQRSFPPDVGGVVVDELNDGIVDVEVEYMPLFQRQSKQYIQTWSYPYSSSLVPRICYSGYRGSVFGIGGYNVCDVSPLPSPITCQLRGTQLTGMVLEVHND